MKVSISVPFGNTTIEAWLEPERDGISSVEFLSPERDSSPGPSEIDNKSLGELFARAKSGKNEIGDFEANLTDDILIVINDATRPTRSDLILEMMMPYFESAGQKDTGQNSRYKLIIATGSHADPTEEELKIILGKLYEKLKARVIYHHAKAKEEHIFVGKSSCGNEFFVDKRAVDAKSLIVIGSVEPHYFAGFTGGRKAFLPGLAYYDTIERNHSLTRYPEATTLSLDNNPLHLEMEEMAVTVENARRKKHGTPGIYSFQMVVSGEGSSSKVSGLFGGALKETFLQAVELSKKINCIPISKKYDVVIAAATPPTDINLYQTQKVIENAMLASKEGGIIIVVSSCWKGIGPRDFYDLMTSKATPAEVFEEISTNYKLGYHKAGKFLQAALSRRIVMVSNLEDNTLKAIGVHPAKNLQEALEYALAGNEKVERTKCESTISNNKERMRDVLVMPAASLTTPVIRM